MRRVFLSFAMIACVALNALWAQTPQSPWQGKGRIVISSDGNEHDDDDWSATPVTLAVLAAAGLQNKLVLYTYSDHVWGSNQTYPLKAGASAYDQMHESALTGKAMFGFKNSRFICAVDNAEVAYEAMKDEINLSSETNPLFIIAAGPMQVVGEAFHRASKDRLKYVTIISHSNWNNRHADNCHGNMKNSKNRWDIHEGWTWDEMVDLYESPENGGVKFDLIKDQNGNGDEHKGLYCKQSYFDWIKNSPARKNSHYKAGSWDWLYSRLEVCIKGKNRDCFDISDSGMAVYLVTGEEEPSVSKLRAILENPSQPSLW